MRVLEEVIMSARATFRCILLQNLEELEKVFSAVHRKYVLRDAGKSCK
jgi:hypothetical protein